jgi:hypothetical protein
LSPNRLTATTTNPTGPEPASQSTPSFEYQIERRLGGAPKPRKAAVVRDLAQTLFASLCSGPKSNLL